MGLLDDAIREHLELKRLRGADPSEVARDERAALGPPEADGYDLAGPDLSGTAGESDRYDEEAPAVDGADWTAGDSDRPAGTDMSDSSEETMEVDMRTIIDADLGRDGGGLELHGDAVAANVAIRGGRPDRTSAGWGIDPNPADRESREQHRRPAARSVRALGLSGGLSAEGSLP